MAAAQPSVAAEGVEARLQEELRKAKPKTEQHPLWRRPKPFVEGDEEEWQQTIEEVELGAEGLGPGSVSAHNMTLDAEVLFRRELGKKLVFLTLCRVGTTPEKPWDTPPDVTDALTTEPTQTSKHRYQQQKAPSLNHTPTMIYLLNERPTTASSLLADLDDTLWGLAPARKLGTSTVLDDVLDGAWAPLLSASRPARARVAGAGGLSLRLDGEANEYVVEGATPGIRRDELKVELVGGRTLEVSFEQHRGGKPKAADKDRDGKAEGGKGEESREVECSSRGYLSIAVPRDADTASGRVEYADGLLRIAFPRTTGAVDLVEERLRVVGGEHAELVAEAGSKRKRVEELRGQLEAERHEVERVEKRLRAVRAETAKRIASERRQLALQ